MSSSSTTSRQDSAPESLTGGRQGGRRERFPSSLRRDRVVGAALAALAARLARVALIPLVVLAGGAGFLWLKARPAPVAHAVVARGAVTNEVLGTGTLAARVSATISPRVAGLLTSVVVDQGDRVSRGQLVATLHDADLGAQVHVAEAEVTVARAAVEEAAAQVAAATASAVEARASYARVSRLLAEGLVSHDDHDAALERRDVAEADLRRARTNEVAASRQVLRAEAAARYTRERLADTRVLAPFDGYVVKRSRDPGDVAVPGDAILEVISTETMWVSAWVDETSMSSVAVGRPARVVFRSEPDRSYEGTVARVSPQVDPETREFLVDVAVKQLPASWGVGQRAEVYVEGAGRRGVLVVPARAIAQRDGRTGVFVDEAGRARWRAVELGLAGKDTVEVRSGLQEGEAVVWTREPADRPLADGRRVARS